MNTKGIYSKLLDELIAGNPQGAELEKHLDMILIWLARPESQLVIDFRNQYKQRKISDEILRGYVLFVLEQKLFAKQILTPYQILGLPTNATKEQSKSRYRKLIRIYHPDKGIGDSAILNSHAEKINQAYKQISTGDRVISSIQSQDVYRSKKVTTPPPVEIKSKKDDLDVVARKLRKKLGGVKNFQKIFFSTASIFCLFLVLLIYFQSGSMKPGDAYYKTKPRLAESTQINDESAVKAAEEEEGVLLSKAKSNVGLTTNDSDVIQQSAVSEVEENQQYIDDKAKIILLDIEEETNTQNEKNLDVSSLHSDNPVEHSPPDNVSKLESIERDLTGKTENIGAKDLDSEFSKVELEKSEPKTKGQSSHTNVVELASVTKKEKLEPVKIKPKPSIAKISKPESATATKAELTNIKTPGINSEIQIRQAPVKEIEVVRISPKSENYSKANIFERKFAHDFIVEYLESIERGNIDLVNDFLSDSLIINGISNFKNSHLKSTIMMIKETNKRTYTIKFIGDVLRIDKGHFRVKLRQQNYLYFKDNTNLKKSSTISYDIKRYKNGSEIVSISEV